MERQPVSSTAIRAIGYATDGGALEVEFQSGSVYRYEGVPEFLFRGFVAAKSKGQFFRSRIQDRYPFRQVQ